MNFTNMTGCHYQITCSKRAQSFKLAARYQVKRIGKLLKYMNLDYRI